MTEYAQRLQFDDSAAFNFLPSEQALAGSSNGDTNQIVAGFNAAKDSLDQTYYGLAALVGDALDNKKIFDYGIEGYKRNKKEAQNNGLRVSDFGQIHNANDAVDFVLGGVGQLAPTALTALAGGGIGGLAIKKGIEHAAQKAIERKIAAGKLSENGKDRALKTLMNRKDVKKASQKGQA